MDKIYFSIPDFWDKYNLNLHLINLFQNERHKFNDDVEIDSIYGCFPCIWNGGRYIDGFTNADNILTTLRPFNNAGIGVRLTFTNSLLNKNHVYDALGNKICQIAEQLTRDTSVKNGVNVSVKFMQEYIESMYPGLYIIHSTTSCLTEIDKINQLSKNNLLVLDYTFNNKFELLSQLENKNNIELLCCETCIDNCPLRKKHYEFISKCQLNFTSGQFNCPNPVSYYYDGAPTRQHYISIDMIREKYLPLGFNKFKINGRKRPEAELIENYILYLVKPEYQNEIRQKLLI